MTRHWLRLPCAGRAQRRSKFGAMVIKGIDPKDRRDVGEGLRGMPRRRSTPSDSERERRTFGRVIRDFHEREIEPSPKFTEKHKAQWIASIENHLPTWRDGDLWNRPIDEVEAGRAARFHQGLAAQGATHCAKGSTAARCRF